LIREFIKDTLKYIPSILGPAVTGLLSVLIFSRLFDPDQYGDYILAMTTVNVMGIISYYWLNSAILRLLPKYIELQKTNIFCSSTLLLAIIGIALSASLSFIIIIGLKNLIPQSLYRLISLGVLLLLVISFYDMCLVTLTARRKIMAYGIFFIWRSLAPIVLGSIMVVFFNFGIEGLLWGNIFGLLIFIPFAYKIAFNESINIPADCSRSVAEEIIKFGFPLVPAVLSVWVLRLSDRYILEYYRNSYEVGLYSIGYDVSEKALHLVSAALMLASGPLIVYTWEKKGKQATEDFVEKLTRYYMLVSMPLVLMMCLLSNEILALISQPAYIEAWKIVPFISVSTFLVGLQWMGQRGLLLANKTDLIMYCYLGCGTVNIILNLFLVPRYGFIAAGATTLLSYALLLLVIGISTRKYFAWRVSIRTIFNISLSCIAASGIILISDYMVKGHVFVRLCANAILGLVIYSGTLFVLREISSQELLTIREFIQNRLSR